jgi:hypothetical protein
VTEEELRGLLAIADILIPGTDQMPTASMAPDIGRWLGVALTARGDVFDEILALAGSLGQLPPAGLSRELRRLSDEEPERFEPLSAIIAGAYLMVPAVRKAIGYPGQERRFPPFDQAADEITSGILDPVIERGDIQPSRAR